MSDGFDIPKGWSFEEFAAHIRCNEAFGYEHAMDAKAEVLMSDAIEAMNEWAFELNEDTTTPITRAERKMAVLRLCGETFERLERERAAELARWQARRDGKS